MGDTVWNLDGYLITTLSASETGWDNGSLPWNAGMRQNTVTFFTLGKAA